jgi:hypothetical protein
VGLVATPARLSRAPGFVTQLLTGPVVTDLMWRPRIPHGKDRAARRDPLSIGIDRDGCYRRRLQAMYYLSCGELADGRLGAGKYGGIVEASLRARRRTSMHCL